MKKIIFCLKKKAKKLTLKNITIIKEKTFIFITVKKENGINEFKKQNRFPNCQTFIIILKFLE